MTELTTKDQAIAPHMNTCHLCGEKWWDSHMCAIKLSKLDLQNAGKLTVTLQDSPVDIELAQFKRMFEAACVDLGLINEALGLDPNDGGAEPILDAIAELKQPPAPDCRTCGHFHHTGCMVTAMHEEGCTNGDKYQPAPAVVLWRTE